MLHNLKFNDVLKLNCLKYIFMKHLKVLFSIAILISLVSTIKSQDSISLHKMFYKKQQQSLSLLSSWSVGNLIYSPIATNHLFSPSKKNEYFYQMNFSWNLLNAGIAGLGHIIVNRDSKKPWDMKTLHNKKIKAEKSIIINMGLDLAYMVAGLLLRNNAKKNNAEESMNKGYGNSLILQGGYLLFYDAIFLINLKKVLINPKSKKDNSTL